MTLLKNDPHAQTLLNRTIHRAKVLPLNLFLRSSHFFPIDQHPDKQVVYEPVRPVLDRSTAVYCHGGKPAPVDPVRDHWLRRKRALLE